MAKFYKSLSRSLLACRNVSSHGTRRVPDVVGFFFTSNVLKRRKFNKLYHIMMKEVLTFGPAHE